MAEKLNQVELDSIHLHETKPRTFRQGSFDNGVVQVDDIETGCGTVHVEVMGDLTKPAILTYHDIGLNSATCFGGFFNYPDMQVILRSFSVYHVTAPGQQESSLTLPHGIGFTGEEALNDYRYPTMDQLAEMLMPVMQFYNMKRFIGFGSGAGANILSRFALDHPDKVEALVLMNGTSGKSGWKEWGYQKLNSWYLKGGSVSRSVEEYLLWHWFGSKTLDENHDLVNCYASYVKTINPTNLSYFIESYIRRTDLGIYRETNPQKKTTARMIRCPVMLVAGDHSPHLNDTVDMNSKMDPEGCQWMKFECGGMIMEEAPNKLAESFRLFLQGMGYVLKLRSTSQYGGMAASPGGAETLAPSLS